MISDLKLCTVICAFLCLFNITDGLAVGVLLGDYPSEEQRLLNNTLSKKYAKGEIIFSANVQRVSEIDSFAASETLCKVLGADNGVLAIFGPRYTTATTILESICLEFEIPYISYSWRPAYNKDRGFFLNFFPEADSYANALSEIIRSFGWKSFVVLYETDDTLLKFKDLLDFQKYNEKDKKNKVSFEKIGSGPDQSELFAKVQRSTHTNIILDCKTELIIPLLRQAKEANLLNVYNNYFLINLDSLTLDYSELNTTANITTIRLFDDSNDFLKESVRKIGLAELIHYRKLKTDTALFYDALWYVHDTIKFFPILFTNPIQCNGTQKFRKGLEVSLSLKNRLPTVSLTGPIQFDDKGSRIDFNIVVVDVLHNKKIATWFENNQSLTVNAEIDQSVSVVTNLQSTKVIVASRLGAPYLSLVTSDEKLEGNAKYEGFSLDLIAHIAKIVGFEFEIYITEDNSYGYYNEYEDTWTGLIGDIIEKKAHLAITDLTITQEREEAVDFSLPFMELGISILYTSPNYLEPDKFIFLTPFSKPVWMTILYSYIFISICLYIVLRLSPDDWEREYPGDDLDISLINNWNFKNALLLTLRALTMQGSDAVPKGKSARLAISMWWLFCLIFTSYYIANLTLITNVTHFEQEFKDVEELGSQNKIKYGMVKGGSTEEFFKYSNSTLYQKMWHTIEQSPSVFAKTTEEGVEKVLNGQYAFFMESTTLEYEVERNCALKQIGEWLDSKGYGIAMPQNAPYRSAINRAILNLQEDGTLAEIKRRWWVEGEEACDREGESSGEMSPENVGGLFIILGIGICIALAVTFIEFLWNIKKVAREERTTYCEAFCTELKTSCFIWSNRRTIKN